MSEPDAAKPSAEDLQREIDRLRAQLAHATAEADTYRQAAYAMLRELVPYVPPTEEELQDMLHGPRGPSLPDLIAELEREGGDEHGPTPR